MPKDDKKEETNEATVVGVDTVRTEVSDKFFPWRATRDAISGSDVVKRADTVYLPMPAGFDLEDTAPDISKNAVPEMQLNKVDSKGLRTEYDMNNAPFWHPNPAYRGYLQRARFPEITLNTLRGLIGLVTKSSSTYESPPVMEYMSDRAGKKGRSLDDVFLKVLTEVLITGRATIVPDIDTSTNEVRLITYRAEQHINWREDEKTGETRMSVLRETRSTPKKNSEFEMEDSQLHVVYSFEESEDKTSEKVILRKFKGDTQIGETITPSLQGVELEQIPTVPVGSLFNEHKPGPSPLSAISEIAYAAYRKDADLSQAQYMTCNPILTITGAKGRVPVALGSSVALMLENPQARAEYPATDTSALNHVKDSISELFEEAARYGATLLGPTQGSAEATDTVRVRQGAQGATLVGTVINVVAALNDALKIAARLHKVDPEKVKYTVSTDFVETLLSPQLILALITAWQNGIFSKESFIALLIENGIIDSASEIEDELARIFSEGPTSNGDAEA